MNTNWCVFLNFKACSNSEGSVVAGGCDCYEIRF